MLAPDEQIEVIIQTCTQQTVILFELLLRPDMYCWFEGLGDIVFCGEKKQIKNQQDDHHPHFLFRTDSQENPVCPSQRGRSRNSVHRSWEKLQLLQFTAISVIEH